jgi:protein arginine N-methyltransferase 1
MPPDRAFPTIHPQTRLRRVPQVQLELNAQGSYIVRVGEKRIGCHRHLPAILALFSAPTAFGDAIRQLNAHVSGAVEWMEMTADIYRLVEAGVLQTDDQPEVRSASMSFFDVPQFHIRMVNDRRRVESYLRAIREIVRPGDIVVEIGTGTGLLAIAAAQAGASRVYAIEAGRIGDAAAHNAALNDVADVVTLVRAWSNAVTLPERGDLLISEIIGTYIFDEGVLPYTLDARQRLLKPGARLLPSAVRAYALALQAPPDLYAAHIPDPSMINSWRERYSIDLGGLLSFMPNAPVRLPRHQRQTDAWRTLSAPALVAEVNLSAFTETNVAATARVPITEGGIVNSVTVYAELQLGSVTFSQHPNATDAANSWGSAIWVLPAPLAVRRGDLLEIDYHDQDVRAVRLAR